eukprot:g7984.t1
MSGLAVDYAALSDHPVGRWPSVSPLRALFVLAGTAALGGLGFLTSDSSHGDPVWKKKLAGEDELLVAPGAGQAGVEYGPLESTRAPRVQYGPHQSTRAPPDSPPPLNDPSIVLRTGPNLLRPLQKLKNAVLGPSALFIYSLDLYTEMTSKKCRWNIKWCAPEEHVAYLYGANWTTGDEALAVVTGRADDVVRGRLLRWNPLLFGRKLQQADEFYDYDPAARQADMTRRAVRVLVPGIGPAPVQCYTYLQVKPPRTEELMKVMNASARLFRNRLVTFKDLATNPKFQEFLANPSKKELMKHPEYLTKTLEMLWLVSNPPQAVSQMLLRSIVEGREQVKEEKDAAQKMTQKVGGVISPARAEVLLRQLNQTQIEAVLHWAESLGEERDTAAEAGGQTVFFKRLSRKALPPSKAPLASGYDLASVTEATVPAGGRAVVQTDIALNLPEDIYGRVAPSSSASAGLVPIGLTVIDRQNRGPVDVLLLNHGEKEIRVRQGDIIAQLILEKLANVELQEALEFPV